MVNTQKNTLLYTDVLWFHKSRFGSWKQKYPKNKIKNEKASYSSDSQPISRSLTVAMEGDFP